MSDSTEQAKCEICGEPMPAGEEMFNYHGYSGPCPKAPLEETSAPAAGGRQGPSLSDSNLHPEKLIGERTRKESK